MEFIAEQTGDVFVRISPRGVVRYISSSIRTLGYEPEDLLGLTGVELVHPDDRAAFVSNTMSALRGATAPLAERVYRFRTGDGRWVWMEGNPRVVRDRRGRAIELVNVLRNVTERRDAELLAAEQAEVFRSAFEHSGVGKALVGLDGRFLNINEAFCGLVGYPKSVMLELDFQTITHPDDLEADLGLLDRLTRGEIPSYRMDKRYLRADGSIVWVHLTVSMIRDDAGAPKLYVAQVQDQTQQRAAETALQESETRFRLLAENASDVMACFGTDARLTYVSSTVEALIGYTPEELVGRSIGVFMHPDDFKASFEIYRSHLEGPTPTEPFHFEYRAFRKDGTMVWLAAHPRAVFEPGTNRLTGFQDVVRDVTVRRAAEAALAEREAQFRLLAENASDLVMQSNPDGTLAYMSPSSLAVTGYAPEEVIGRSALHWVHPDDRQAVIDAFQEQVSGRGAAPQRIIEFRVRTRDGRDIWMEASPRANIDPATGDVASVTDAARDVTARKALEASLSEARDAAERAARVKADFMANMSHEIRTPLTAILGFTALLGGRDDLAEEAVQQLARVSSAGQALLALVNDVLDFSKLEAGQMPIKPRPAALRETMAEAVALFEPQAAAKGITLALEGAGDLPEVWIDPDRLRQVLLNLVGNAAKFTAEGGVTVRPSYDAGTGRLRVEIADSGPGMDADQQTRLFQRFSQVDASAARRHGGTGLGLAICRGLIDAMGGDIGVTSEVGRGSTFWFEIPAPIAEIEDNEIAADAVSLAGVRVLVVDDNPVNRELVRMLLTQFEARVTEASDGETAVALAGQETFDAILMDIRMPGLDGPNAAMQIRRREGPSQDAPILAFTADYDLERYGAQAGQAFDGVVTKPINACELISAIAERRRDPTSASQAA